MMTMLYDALAGFSSIKALALSDIPFATLI
jgi:hypothetical protein